MARTYNGRFKRPDDPKNGTKWLVAGLACLALCTAFGPLGLAASVGCFVAYGKRAGEKRIVRRFHEYCAVIGMRTRVGVKELAKIGDHSKGEVRQQLQQMIARGYFGEDAYLDVTRDELVLPPVPGARETARGGWRDIVFDLLGALKGEKIFTEPAQDAEYTRETPKAAPARPAEAAKPAEAPKPEPERAAKPRSCDSVKKTYMDELERTLAELYQLNEQIQDEDVSARIDRIGTLTGGIFRAVIENPEREQDVRKFMNYYLPTTLKLLKSYSLLEHQSYQGENIAASRKKIENVLDMLIEAFEKQLDRLFRNDALDIATDIDVLETMMAGDGLSEKGQLRMG